jgi:protein TonB
VTTLTLDGGEPERSGEFVLWLIAAIVVLALHVGLATTYLLFRSEPEPRAEAPAIDVAFMPATPAAQPPAIDQPDPAPTKMDQPEAPPKEPPPPVQEVTPPPQVEAVVPPPELPPPPPVPEEATIVPPEKPVQATPVPEKPAVAPPPKPHHDEKVEKRQAPPKAVAAPAAKPARVALAPNAGAESEGARVGRESWLSELAAKIRRAAAYPSGSRDSGTAQVSITIARTGRLVARRLAASSGSAVLDQAALAAIDRAQPFPPFPAGMTEAQVTKLVPMHLRPQ